MEGRVVPGSLRRCARGLRRHSRTPHEHGARGCHHALGTPPLFEPQDPVELRQVRKGQGGGEKMDQAPSCRAAAQSPAGSNGTSARGTGTGAVERPRPRSHPHHRPRYGCTMRCVRVHAYSQHQPRASRRRTSSHSGNDLAPRPAPPSPLSSPPLLFPHKPRPRPPHRPHTRTQQCPTALRDADSATPRTDRPV